MRRRQLLSPLPSVLLKQMSEFLGRLIAKDNTHRSRGPSKGFDEFLCGEKTRRGKKIRINGEKNPGSL